jgi:flagellar hook-associated protein 3 FlgL
MRITNNIIRENALTNMRRSLQQIESAQQQVGTGLRLTRASDDPAAAASAMTTRVGLRALDQYRSGIDIANVRTSAEEGILNQLTDILVRVKTIGLSQVSGTADDTTRDASRLEVEGLLRHAVSLSGTKVAGNYLFGGNKATVAPFDIDDSGPTLSFTTTSPTGDPEVEISNRQWIASSHNGQTVFGTQTGGVLHELRQMVAALDSGDTDAIGAVLANLDGAIDGVQDLVIDAGVRLNQLEMSASNLDAVEMHLTTLKSDLEEVDAEEAITELVSRQTAYQSAMLATSRVMGLTLTDYLR